MVGTGVVVLWHCGLVGKAACDVGILYGHWFVSQLLHDNTLGKAAQDGLRALVPATHM